MSFAIPKTMRAAVYRGEGRIVIEEVPVPAIRQGEVLVQVAACGVCPTDIKKIQHDLLPAPRIYGHETSGTIVKLGAGISGWRVGDRVALHHHVPCLQCHACAHHAFAQCPGYKRTGITAGFEPAGGGFAEYVRVMPFVRSGLVKIPRANSFLEGALLEPVNTVLKGIKMLSLLERDHVLVAGQGPIGLMFTGLLKARGLRVIATDLMPERLRVARALGAAQALSGADPDLPDRIRKITRGRGLDAAVIAVPSSEAVHQAQSLLRGGGQVLLFAHTRRGDRTPIDLSTICVDEKSLLGSYSSDFTLQKEVARTVFSRTLDVRKLVTHEFPLEQTAEAIALAAKPSPGSLKIVVRPGLK